MNPWSKSSSWADEIVSSDADDLSNLVRSLMTEHGHKFILGSWWGTLCPWCADWPGVNGALFSDQWTIIYQMLIGFYDVLTELYFYSFWRYTARVSATAIFTKLYALLPADLQVLDVIVYRLCIFISIFHSFFIFPHFITVLLYFINSLHCCYYLFTLSAGWLSFDVRQVTSHHEYTMTKSWICAAKEPRVFNEWG